MPRLEYPTGTQLWMCPSELAMDMVMNIGGSKKVEVTRVKFLEPISDTESKILNSEDRIEIVGNGRLSTWR